jgi:hypothetical protein
MMRTKGRRKPRLLFCSYHCYVDTASGAAQCMRDLLTLLAARGWTCGVLSLSASPARTPGASLERGRPAGRRRRQPARCRKHRSFVAAQASPGKVSFRSANPDREPSQGPQPLNQHS